MVISWFVDHSPAWLGPAIVCAGIFIIIVNAEVVQSFSEEYRKRWLIPSSFFLVLLSGYFHAPSLSTVAIAAMGGWIEGIGSIRFYQKVVYTIIRTSLPPSSLGKKVVLYSASAFVVMCAILLSIAADALGYVTVGFIDLLLIGWTVGTALVSIVGISIRLSPLRTVVREDDRVPINSGSIYGLTLCVAGAVITNLSTTFDIVSFALNSVSYTVGYWLAVYLWYQVVIGGSNWSAERELHDQFTS